MIELRCAVLLEVGGCGLVRRFVRSMVASPTYQSASAVWAGHGWDPGKESTVLIGGVISSSQQTNVDISSLALTC